MQLPDKSGLRAVTERYAALIARLDSELGQRPLVLPNGDFFPDTFQQDAGSAERLVARMLEHAGMADIPVTVRVIDAEMAASAASSCSSGGCSAPLPAAGSVQRLVEDNTGWVLQLHPAELVHPVALTASLARALANIFLLDTLEEGQRIEDPMEVTNDLTAVALGFGTLMLQGAYIYSKSCGGPSVQSVTHLGCGELAMAFALFVQRDAHPWRDALRLLDTTQRALVEEARSWVEGNEALERELREHPESVALGHFELREARPWLARMLGLGGARSGAAEPGLEELAASLQSKRREPSTRRPQDDELRSLVDEALSEVAPPQA